MISLLLIYTGRINCTDAAIDGNKGIILQIIEFGKPFTQMKLGRLPGQYVRLKYPGLK